MILDTSAQLAVLLNEPEAGWFATAIENAGAVRLSAASYVEAATYVDRNGDAVCARCWILFSRSSRFGSSR
jgi:uncharacterized protein with PIN domain